MELNEKGQTLQAFLEAYDASRYPRPSVTLDMVVFTYLPQEEALGVLLIKRKDHPFIGKWALPGGFLNMDESLEAGAARELLEETGVSGLPLRQFYTFGAPKRDPRTRVISVGYFAVAQAGVLRPAAGDDAAQAGIFSLLPAQGKAGILYARVEGAARLLASARRVEDCFLETLAPDIGATDFACDHAYVLLMALMALLALPRARVCALLGGGQAALAAWDEAMETRA